MCRHKNSIVLYESADLPRPSTKHRLGLVEQFSTPVVPAASPQMDDSMSMSIEDTPLTAIEELDIECEPYEKETYNPSKTLRTTKCSKVGMDFKPTVTFAQDVLIWVQAEFNPTRGRSERWVLLYAGEDDQAEHYVWEGDHAHSASEWCEHCKAVCNWMILVKLSNEIQNVCKTENVSMAAVLRAIGAIDERVSNRLAKHLTYTKKKVADPRLNDFPPFEPVCKDTRLCERSMEKTAARQATRETRMEVLTNQALPDLC
eukprot:6065373-Amphidinium_carterae.2